jgi:MFS transporter, UMF1 family
MTDASTGAREAAKTERDASRVGGVWAPAGFSWALFEFARNPYYMLIVTYVFPPYFSQFIVGNPVEGQAAIAEATKWAGVIGALTAPFLGAMMDRGGARKPLMGVFLAMIAISGLSLWWSMSAAAPNPIDPSKPIFHPPITGLGMAGTMMFLVLGFVGYTYSELTHNAMLRSSGRPDALSRISGAGIGLGQLSSALCLAGLVVIASVAPALGGAEEGFALQRGTGPFVAIFLVIFVIPFFIYMPDGAPPGGSWKRSWEEMMQAIRPRRSTPRWYWFALSFGVVYLLIFSMLFAFFHWQNPVAIIAAPMPVAGLAAYVLAPRLACYLERYIRESPETMKYLGARLIYADGLVALLALAGVFAAGMFRWDVAESALFGIYASIFGAIGAFLIGPPLDRKLGARKAIMVELSVMCVGVVIALSATPDTILYGLVPANHAVHGLPFFNTLAEVFYLALAAVIAATAAACITSSRYFMMVLAPKERTSEFFGLYAISSTATVWMGPMMVEFATRASGDQRIGFSPVLLLLAVGLALMFTLKRDTGDPNAPRTAAH